MVNTKMYKQIQTLKRKGYSKTEISSELNLNSRTTVKYFHITEIRGQSSWGGPASVDSMFTFFESENQRQCSRLLGVV